MCQDHAAYWIATQDPTVADLTTDIPEMVGVYVQSAALLAADWYDSQNEASSYLPIPVDKITEERLANMAAWIHAGPQSPQSRIRTAAHKVVFDAARNTIQANAQIEGVAIARQESADACTDCAVRATVAAKARNSRSDDVATDFHPSCEGMLVPVRRGPWSPPGYTHAWRERIAQARHAGNVTPDDIANWLKDH